MSIQIHPELGEPDLFRVECNSRGTLIGRDYHRVAALFHEHQASCTDPACRPYHHIAPSWADNPPALSVSQHNAARLFEALGILVEPDSEVAGSEDADVFLGRVLLAEALAPQDEGMLPHVAGADELGFDRVARHMVERGARVVMAERPAGWLQDRLSRVRSVAEWAAAHDRKVVWS